MDSLNLDRILTRKIIKNLNDEKMIHVIYGPRQVGKTTLLEGLIKKLKLNINHINADSEKYHEILSSRNLNYLKDLVMDYDGLFIDEAQRVKNIGVNLKLLVDNFPNKKFFVTGSSALDLASDIKEPLTGRTWSYHLFPISYQELSMRFDTLALKEQLEERLIFGSYPKIFQINSRNKKMDYLDELVSSNLYKDILELSNIKHSQKIYKLLKLIAFQIGSPVSITELGGNLGMTNETVNHYIDLLEKSFVLFRLGGFSRNLRNELTKMDKIYFYDMGVRNSLIQNYDRLIDRDDRGKLFENFLIAERFKFNSYNTRRVSAYFWRNYEKAEIDYIEEEKTKLKAFEFKWSNKKSSKIPRAWLNNYGDDFTVINSENFLEFIADNNLLTSIRK
jgi:predicted AAA+ superfamily ATPase